MMAVDIINSSNTVTDRWQCQRADNTFDSLTTSTAAAPTLTSTWKLNQSVKWNEGRKPEKADGQFLMRPIDITFGGDEEYK